MSVLNLTSENFEEEVKRVDRIVVVDFYADWCGPCKMMSPIIDKVAEELGDSVKVGKVNTDENLSLAEEFGIMSIPTIMIFRNGKVEKVFNGVTDKKELEDAINAM